MSFVTRRALSTLIPPKVCFSPADGSHHIGPYSHAIRSLQVASPSVRNQSLILPSVAQPALSRCSANGLWSNLQIARLLMKAIA